MNNTNIEQIKQLIDQKTQEHHGLNALARKAGVDKAFVSRLKNGKLVRPGLDSLEKLSIALGKDRFFLENLFYNRDNSESQAWNNISPAPPKNTKERLIPVFDVAAGKFLFDPKPDDYPLGQSDEYESAVSSDPNAVWLRVNGDSMTGANINDGDLVLVEPSLEVKNGDIIVCNKNGDGVTIKYIDVKPDRVELRPANHKYSPIILSKEDAAECRFFKIVLVKPKEWKP